MTKREAFVVVMTMLAETYRVAVTDAMLDGYWLVLDDLTEAQLKVAARAALSRPSGFMPSPGELLAFVRPAVSMETASVVAWQAVRRAIDVHDYLVATIDFGPLVNAVIRNLGGWDTLCRATLPELDNPGWLRKRFEEVYRALSTTNPQALNGEALSGALPPNYQDPPHVVVSIDGSPQPKRIESNGEARDSIAAHVRDLAESKS